MMKVLLPNLTMQSERRIAAPEELSSDETRAVAAGSGEALLLQADLNSNSGTDRKIAVDRVYRK